MFDISTRKVGRVRLLRIGRFAFAFCHLRPRLDPCRQPVWLSASGERLPVPEILL